MSGKSAIARSLLGAAYLAVAVLAFVTGRGHRVYFENPPGSGPFSVSVPGGKPVRVRENGQRMLMVQGQRATFRAEFEDGRPALEASFSIPLGTDAAIVTVVAGGTGALAARAAPSDTEER